MQVNTMVSQLAGGMLVSTEIFVVTLLFSLPLGLLIAFGRMSKNKILQGIVKTYISIMRGTPLMLHRQARAAPFGTRLCLQSLFRTRRYEWEVLEMAAEKTKVYT